jgi:hypothetical protein
MMRKTIGFLLIVLALSACVAQQPSFGTVASGLPSVPAGQARIFFYRWLEPYEAVSMSRVYLNGAPVAVSQVGTVLYRDVSPGQYSISVFSPGTYPDQFKTVAITAGEVIYVHIESLASYKSACGTWGSCEVDTFVVAIVNPATASQEMQNLRFIQG